MRMRRDRKVASDVAHLVFITRAIGLPPRINIELMAKNMDEGKFVKVIAVSFFHGENDTKHSNVKRP